MRSGPAGGWGHRQKVPVAAGGRLELDSFIRGVAQLHLMMPGAFADADERGTEEGGEAAIVRMIVVGCCDHDDVTVITLFDDALQLPASLDGQQPIFGDTEREVENLTLGLIDTPLDGFDQRFDIALAAGAEDIGGDQRYLGGVANDDPRYCCPMRAALLTDVGQGLEFACLEDRSFDGCFPALQVQRGPVDTGIDDADAHTAAIPLRMGEQLVHSLGPRGFHLRGSVGGKMGHIIKQHFDRFEHLQNAIDR